MRLTLRTLLAHEHGLLNEQQAELISQKIEQSPFVAQLLRHLKDRAARREIVPLGIEARGTVCLEKVTRYLDYTLSAEEVVKLENECFASDRLLAEVTSCHEIISQWLSTPTPTEPGLRQRLYAIMPGPIGAIPAASDELAIDLPALAYQSTPPSSPIVEKDVPRRPIPPKSGWIGGAFRLFALAACVLVLVTYVTMNRDKVESIIAHHWHDKSQAASGPTETLSPSVNPLPPESLASQGKPMTPIESVSARDEVPAPLPEVATTAFHMPIPVDQRATNTFHWNVDVAAGAFHQDIQGENWQSVASDQMPMGRLVVVPGGKLQLSRHGHQLEVGPLSELITGNDGITRLRYGSLDLSMEPGQELVLDVAGLKVEIAAPQDPVRVAIATRAVVSRGIDFAANAANQEVQFEGISGKVQLTIPGCRGPIPLEYGQMIIAQMNHGVRSGETSIAQRIRGEAAGGLAEAIHGTTDPVRFLRDSISSERPDVRLDAATALLQLGIVGDWTDAWRNLSEHQQLESRLEDIQTLLAQDSALAAEVGTALSQQSPEYGPLVYRLICGFSDDQLTAETQQQLETLLRHPEPAVQAWTRFQLTK
ncbi:hypothetical protein [Bremerella sp.]|uniref:hypothetical protein n=1 Tax=Bremerella sp. TaxID=2795602 RepID=UPI003919766E